MVLGRLGIAICLALLMETAAADWLQPGYDAARTGAVPGGAPAWDDVLYEVTFDVFEGIDSEPLILGDRVYVLDDGPSKGRIHVFPLREPGQATILAELDFDPDYFVSDGERLFVLDDIGGVVALDLAGTRLWRSELAAGTSAVTSTPSVNCQHHAMVVDGDALHVACTSVLADTPVAYSLETASGLVRWRWVPSLEQNGEATADEDPTAIATDILAEAQEAARVPVLVDRGISAGAGLALVMTSYDVADSSGTSQGSGWALYAINATSGNTAWIEESLPALEAGFRNLPPAAAVGDGRIFVEGRTQALVLEMREGTIVGRTPILIRDAPALEGDPGSGFALGDGAAFATSRSRLHRIGPELTIEWTYPPTSTTTSEEWAPRSLTLAGDVVLAQAEPIGTANAEAGAPFLYAIDARFGELLWRHRFDRNVHLAVSDGNIAAVGFEGAAGKFTVLGRSPASIGVVAVASESYPDPGDVVTVDMTDTSAGALGPAIQFKADWGDGEETPWQSSPLFTHRYSVPADVTARFYARNAAGQTASVPVEFFVGDTSRLPFLAQQFTRDNQERTFFVLGLAATGGAGVFGLVRLSRKRDRFQRELAAVEQAYAMTRDRPTECEAALAERKAHCQGLFLDSKLEEGQFALLARRIDELRASLRLQVIDERLEFLPLGMVKALQGVLEDGRVSAWERRHFIEALDRDRLLTPDQKAQVRALIDEWFERDSGAARPPERP